MRAGLDLEMPGPAKARAELLAEAEADAALQAAVRTAARNVLRLLARTGTLTHPQNPRIDAEHDEEHADTRALIRRAGAAGTESHLVPYG